MSVCGYENAHCVHCGAFYANNGACGNPECCGQNYDYSTCECPESACYGDRGDCFHAREATDNGAGSAQENRSLGSRGVE